MAKKISVDIDGTLNVVLKQSGVALQKHNPGHPQHESLELTWPEEEKYRRAIDEHRVTLTKAEKSGVVIEDDI